MNNKVILTLAFITLTISSLINPMVIKADSYSNNDNRKTLSIDKKLRSIHSSVYVDNISSARRVFYQDDVIEFKIKVTNTGTTNMRNIKVTDNLPPFLKLIFFPGSYNSTDNKIEWTIDELNAGHSQEFLVRARIDKATEVRSLTKETNVAIATVDGITEKDDAIYYLGGRTVVESDGKGEVIIPETGSMDLVIQTVGVISLGLSGFALRKKIRGY